MRLGDGDRPKVVRAWVPPTLGAAPVRDVLLAIAARVYDPTIDDGEWSARIKDRVARDGLSAADPDKITMVIRLLSKRLTRPDPFAAALKFHTRDLLADPPRGPLTRDEARGWYVRLQAEHDRRNAQRE